MAATNGAFWTQQFLKATGLPYVGVRVFHWVAGNTETNLNVFQDGAMTAAHNNPVVGDATGRVSFYGSGTYRLQVRTSTADGNLILYDWDPVELVHHTATVRAEDRGLSVPAATAAARGRLFGVTDVGGDLSSLWLQRSAAEWREILTLPVLSQMIQYAKGTDIASTANVTIPTNGNFFDVTGSNPIETFSGFTGHPLIYTRFLGTPLLVNGANFLLPQNANYQTLANELIAWMPVGAGVWAWLSSNRVPTVNTLTAGYGLVGDGTGRLVTRNILPIGIEMFWPVLTPPTHWIRLFGQELSRTTYADYFALIGTSYGDGNGTTTFNAPPWHGRTGIGVDTGNAVITSASTGGANANAVGEVGGAETHTMTIAEMPAHTHMQNRGVTPGAALIYAGVAVGNNVENDQVTDSTGGGGAHSNTQPWIARAVIAYVGV